MKKVLLAAAAVIALPAIAEAQDVQAPGVYIGVEGGLNWMFNTTVLGQNVADQALISAWFVSDASEPDRQERSYPAAVLAQLETPDQAVAHAAFARRGLG